MDGLQKRLREFIDYVGLSINYFEMEAHLSPGSINKMTDGTRMTTLLKIQRRFPQLDVNWVKFGRGSMIRPIPRTSYHLGNNSQLAMGDINNIRDINSPDIKLSIMEERLSHLEYVIEEKDRQIKIYEERIKELVKMIELIKGDRN